MWWFLLMGFLVGVVISVSISILRFNKLFAGELQIYDTEDGQYPVLSVEDGSVFKNGWIILKVKTYNSQK